MRASILRAYRSRISSGISIRTVPGSGIWVSLHTRFEKPDLSDVIPCRRMPTVLPPGSVMAASMGIARYQRKLMGWATLATAEATR